MRTRIGPIVALITLTLASVSNAQQTRAEFTCPVTKAAPVTFKPIVWSDSPGLVGTEKLFTIFPGNWNYVQKTDRGYRVPKLFFGTNVVDLSAEVRRSSLTISGRRLDAISSPLVFGDANTAWSYESGRIIGLPDEAKYRKYFITAEFLVPTLGCWEVTAHFHGEDLKVVVDLEAAAR